MSAAATPIATKPPAPAVPKPNAPTPVERAAAYLTEMIKEYRRAAEAEDRAIPEAKRLDQQERLKHLTEQRDYWTAVADKVQAGIDVTAPKKKG